MKLILRPRAVADLEEIVEYIARDRPEAARAFATAVMQTCENLIEFPVRHTLIDLPEVAERGIRRVAMNSYRNYLIFYVAHADAVEIQRVLHGGRDLAPLLGEADAP